METFNFFFLKRLYIHILYITYIIINVVILHLAANILYFYLSLKEVAILFSSYSILSLLHEV